MIIIDVIALGLGTICAGGWYYTLRTARRLLDERDNARRQATRLNQLAADRLAESLASSLQARRLADACALTAHSVRTVAAELSHDHPDEARQLAGVARELVAGIDQVHDGC